MLPCFVVGPHSVAFASENGKCSGVYQDATLLDTGQVFSGKSTLEAKDNPSIGEQSTVILKLEFPNAPHDPNVTDEWIISEFFDKNNPQSENSWFSAGSNGKVWFTGEVMGWKTMPLNIEEYFDQNRQPLLDKMAEDAIAQFDPEVDFSKYARVMFCVTHDDQRRYNVGLWGSIGMTHYSTNDGVVSLSSA